MPATDPKTPQPIIKKIIKKGGHGHHGGAWKVAYADFVTAMMAFFLLLWLLNVTTKEQKQGISEYFSNSPSVVQNIGGGSGVFGGEAMLSQQQLQGTGVPNPKDKASDESQRKKEEEAFRKAEDQLKKAIEQVPELKELQDSLIIQRTPEGLRIQIVDQDRREMFPLGSASMYDHTAKLITLVAQVISQLPNKIAVSGHTDATAYGAGADYGNWELSADRANAARRVLERSGGIPETRLHRVAGKAASEPLNPENDPYAANNRRISILLIRESLVQQEEEMNRQAASGAYDGDWLTQ